MLFFPNYTGFLNLTGPGQLKEMNLLTLKVIFKE